MKGARENLELALHLQPGSAEALYKLALVDLAEKHEDVALRELETVTQASPKWLEPHVKLAAMYYSLHRPADGARERQLVDRLIAAQQAAPPPVR
jgi:hypothetical protein